MDHHRLAEKRPLDLCETCASTFRNTAIDLSERYGVCYDLHATIDGFINAADQGCFICYNVLKTMIGIPEQEILRSIRDSIPHIKGIHEDDCWKHHSGITYFFVSYEIQTKDISRLWITARMWSRFFLNKRWDYNPRVVPELQTQLHHMENYVPNYKWGEGFTFEVSMAQDRNSTSMKTTARILSPAATSTFQNSRLICGSDFHQSQVTSTSTGSDETFSKVHSWIRACESNHALCANRGDNGSWYPTRLVDLGLPDELSENTAELRAKLVRGDDVPPGTRYITLSHRWNDANQLKLSKELLDLWWQAVPTDKLSPIFRDFVIVARRLGIRHVWIDSICIIQDGDAGVDWSHQAGIMDQIYRNSFCNISADWGSNTDGLFFDREMSQFSQRAILLRLRTDKEADEVTYSYLVHDMQTWDREVAKAPLSSRGWVIQEWVLPARTLHFCRTEVFFECCQGAACERYFRGVPVFGPVKSPIHFKDLRLEGRGNLESRNIRRRKAALGQKVYYYNAWTRIRDTYSSCNLTFTRDKLVAISGICRYLKSHLSDETYVAGLWLFNLASQMTWYCDSEKLCLRRANDRNVSERSIIWDMSTTPGMPSLVPAMEYTAPSFSWASANYPVMGGSALGLEVLVTAICIKYRDTGASGRDELITWDVFGPLSANLIELKVEGKLKSAKLVDIGRKALVVWPSMGRYDPRHMDLSKGWDSYSVHFQQAQLDFAVRVSDVLAFEERVFYYMPWRGYQSYVGDSIIDPEQEVGPFLPQFLLFELVDFKMGRFRRIGMFQANGEVTLEYEQSQHNEEELPCWAYNKETGKHTIYII